MKFKMDKQSRLMEMDIKQKASKSMAPMRDSEEDIPNLLHRPQSGLQAGKQGRFMPKGKIIKGTPFSQLKNNMEGVDQLNGMRDQLADSNQVIMMQKLEIRSLKEQIIQMMGEKGERVVDVEDYEREGFLPRVDSKH